MAKKSHCHVAFLLALLAVLPSLLSGNAYAAETTPDSPPTVVWLDGDYDVATYLGCGMVRAGKTYIIPGRGMMRGSHNTIINLNSEIIFPIDTAPLLGEHFYMGYILAYRHSTEYGLLDQFGNIAVPMEFESVEEAWAQVGLLPPQFPYIYAPKAVMDDDSQLYGFQSEDGALLVDYQYDDAMTFTGRIYTRVNQDGRCGLLKNPEMKDTISDWAMEEVNAALEAGLVPSRCAGYYTFEITRSQMAALLVQYSELVSGEVLPLPTEHPFTDTQDAFIEKAYNAGIVQGTGDGLFAPDKVVTREQLFTMLYRTIIKMNPEWGNDISDPVEYDDFDQVSDWAKEAVSALHARGILSGVSVSATQISPKSYCTTEQAIALVYRLAVNCK